MHNAVLGLIPGDAGGAISSLISLAIVVVVVAGLWKVFTKAGKPGWAVLVPIYNIICLLDIAGKPWWWLFLFAIPLVSIVVAILIGISIAQNFGKGTGFGIGLALLGPIFYPLLGFSDAQYRPVAQSQARAA